VGLPHSGTRHTLAAARGAGGRAPTCTMSRPSACTMSRLAPYMRSAATRPTCARAAGAPRTSEGAWRWRAGLACRNACTTLQLCLLSQRQHQAGVPLCSAGHQWAHYQTAPSSQLSSRLLADTATAGASLTASGPAALPGLRPRLHAEAVSRVVVLQRACCEQQLPVRAAVLDGHLLAAPAANAPGAAWVRQTPSTSTQTHTVKCSFTGSIVHSQPSQHEKLWKRACSAAAGCASAEATSPRART